VLTELRVRDLAVIADVALPLNPGLNVLTGETGAGKSMLVDALALLLGERASADIVRPGAPRTVVEAVFEVPANPALAAAADAVGVDLEDGRLVVRREINAEGRNRAWANGSPTTVAALATLGRLLVDLHGQHEAQSLLKPASQRDMLDAYADAADERERVAAAFREAGDLRGEETALAARRDDVRKRADYLRSARGRGEAARQRRGTRSTGGADAGRAGDRG
jgi:DNA repair protein RecN (Recombination protein N)